MKHKKVFLAAFIIVAVLCTGIVPVYAYFTANTEAQGGLTIKREHTEPSEEIFDKRKQLTIKNAEDGASVYIRARGFSGDDSDLTYSGENWHDGGDGWWYFDQVLHAGETTDVLVVNIEKVIPEDAEPGDSFNVVVVYESARVKYGYDDAESAFRASTEQ